MRISEGLDLGPCLPPSPRDKLQKRLQALASLPGTSYAISATHEVHQRTLVSLFGLAAR